MDKREQLMLQLSLIHEQNLRRSGKYENDSFRRLNSIPPLCRRLSEWHSYHILQLSETSNQKSCLALVAPIWLSLLRLAIETPIGRNVKDVAELIADWQVKGQWEQTPALASGALILDLLRAVEKQPCDIKSLFVVFVRLQHALQINDDQLFRQTIQLLELGASFRVDCVNTSYA